MSFRKLAACETIGGALASNPAGLHDKAVQVLALYLCICQSCSVILACLAAAGERDCTGRDLQCARGGRVDARELIRHICATLEDMEVRHRVHCLLALARCYVCHGAVGCCRPGEALGQACHREVVVCCLGQRSTVVSLLAAARGHLDFSTVLANGQRAESLAHSVIAFSCRAIPNQAVTVLNRTAHFRDGSCHREGHCFLHTARRRH